MKEQLKITTARLVIRPFLEPMLMQKAQQEPDVHMRGAYEEILQNVRRHPAEWLWYTEWGIFLLDGCEAGGIGFKGPGKQTLEIGYGIDLPYRRQGYATEAVQAMMAWAWAQNPALENVTAQIEEGNEASRGVLMKVGFTPDGMGEEGPRYIYRKAMHITG